MWDKSDGLAGSGGLSVRQIACDTLVVVWCWAHTPANQLPIEFPCLLCFRVKVCNDLGAQRCERDSIEIELSIDASTSQKSGVGACCAQEIQCDVGLQDEAVPFQEWEVWISRD